jgi:hypothetical protein
MRMAFAITVCIALLAAATRGQEEAPSLPALAGALGHDDPAVRGEAAEEILRSGVSVTEIDLLLGRKQGDTPVVYPIVDRLRTAVFLAERLRGCEEGSAPFWLRLEDLLGGVAPGLRHAALSGTTAAAQRLRERAAAQATVAEFLRDWNENYVIGSEEEKRYAALRQRLEATGAAALPHLLEPLETTPWKAFGNLDPDRGVTARIQVRAIFGLSFLKFPEAVPSLVLHARSTSYTAAADAAATLALILGQELPAPLAPADVAKIDAWWAGHRGEYAEATARLVAAVARSIHVALAREVLGIRDRWEDAPDLSVAALELLTGEKLAWDPSSAPEQRLADARRIAAKFASGPGR